MFKLQKDTLYLVPQDAVKLYNIPVTLDKYNGPGLQITIGHQKPGFCPGIHSYIPGAFNENEAIVLKMDNVINRLMYPVIKVYDNDPIWTFQEQSFWCNNEYSPNVWSFNGQLPKGGFILEFDTENVFKDMAIIDTSDQTGASIGRAVKALNHKKYEKEIYTTLKDSIKDSN